MRRIGLLLGFGILTGSLLAQSTLTSIPTDPGMYVTTTHGISKIVGQIVTFRRTGSLAVSRLTVGIKTSKENVQLLGAHAQTVADSTPVFYFIPAKQEADAGVNAGDLILVRLEEKSERRQFEIGAQGLWRASSGISITHQVQLFRSEEKPGVYKVIPANPLNKGEYALYIARGEGLSPYVYDFSVERETVELQPTFQPRVSARVEPSTGTSSSSQVATSSSASQKITSTPTAPTDRVRALQSNSPATIEDGGSTMSAGSGSAAPGNTAPDYDVEVSVGAWFHGNPAARHDGVEVSGVQQGSVFDEIGIKPGDFILALDDHYVFTIQELHNELRSHPRGSRVAVRYRRHSLIYDMSIEIGPGQV